MLDLVHSGFLFSRWRPTVWSGCDQFIERELRWSQENTRQEPIRSVGKYHDLGELFDELNNEFFHQACVSQITWGKAEKLNAEYVNRPARGLRSRVESHSIHPSLDQSFVPRFYVRWIIFHEIFMGSLEFARKVAPTDSSTEFVALEESYPDYAQCMAWQRGNLKRLLSYSGKT